MIGAINEKPQLAVNQSGRSLTHGRLMRLGVNGYEHIRIHSKAQAPI